MKWKDKNKKMNNKPEEEPIKFNSDEWYENEWEISANYKLDLNNVQIVDHFKKERTHQIPFKFLVLNKDK